jgi:hypothetical protein
MRRRLAIIGTVLLAMLGAGAYVALDDSAAPPAELDRITRGMAAVDGPVGACLAIRTLPAAFVT